jgi:hypothetical protein
MESEPPSDSGRWGWGPPMAKEQKIRDLTAVKESLEQEQIWRNRIAQKHGWSIHPNDMELTDAERRVVLLAWELGAPQPYPDRRSDETA